MWCGESFVTSDDSLFCPLFWDLTYQDFTVYLHVKCPVIVHNLLYQVIIFDFYIWVVHLSYFTSFILNMEAVPGWVNGYVDRGVRNNGKMLERIIDNYTVHVGHDHGDGGWRKKCNSTY